MVTILSEKEDFEEQNFFDWFGFKNQRSLYNMIANQIPRLYSATSQQSLLKTPQKISGSIFR